MAGIVKISSETFKAHENKITELTFLLIKKKEFVAYEAEFSQLV